MKFPCATVIDCPGGGDFPIRNYSSEGPDAPIWIGFSGGWGHNKPPLGTPWRNPDGFNYCLSTIGQADAQRCANNGEPDQWSGNGISTDPPPHAGDGGGWNGVDTFGSDQESCIYTCPDGTQFVWTVAAGYARATSRTQADNIANSLACRLAIAHKICLSALDNPTACAGVGYFATVKASIGTLATLPLTWTIVLGNLPPGTALDTDTGGDPNVSKTVGIIGTISPSASGSYTFTLRATDAGGNFLQKSYTISILVFTNIPTSATQNTAYSFQLGASGGSAPYTFLVSGGSLPAGLTMNSTGLISGTPTTTGTSSFTVQATDQQGKACTKDFTIAVSPGDTCATEIAALDWVDSFDGSHQHGASISFSDTANGVTHNHHYTTTITNTTGTGYNIRIKAVWSGSNNNNIFSSGGLSLYIDGGFVQGIDHTFIATWTNEVPFDFTLFVAAGASHNIDIFFQVMSLAGGAIATGTGTSQITCV